MTIWPVFFFFFIVAWFFYYHVKSLLLAEILISAVLREHGANNSITLPLTKLLDKGWSFWLLLQEKCIPLTRCFLCLNLFPIFCLRILILNYFAVFTSLFLLPLVIVFLFHFTLVYSFILLHYFSPPQWLLFCLWNLHFTVWKEAVLLCKYWYPRGPSSVWTEVWLFPCVWKTKKDSRVFTSEWRRVRV